MRTVLWVLLLIILAAGTYAYLSDTVEAPGTLHDERTISIEEYIRQNISSLSTEPAVLGGTFYVTKVEAKDGRGIVWYEDGHVAHVADFAYLIDKYGITVTTFDVRN